MPPAVRLKKLSAGGPGRFLMLINCCFGCIISVYYQRFVVIMLKVSYIFRTKMYFVMKKKGILPKQIWIIR